MFTYTFKNLNTNHIFYQSNTLSHVVAFYHKVPRRKTTTLAIIDNITGELIKVKAPK